MSLAAPPEGASSFLQYTGIPPSWLKKRPRLPSRNWLIFLSTTASLSGLYLYDRRQCNQIRNEYVNKVKHLSEEPLPSLAFPRKVIVYGSKWPGDEDADKSIKYFRKYVKPILVAAAIDYEIVNGKHHGRLSDLVADNVKAKRRLDLGLDSRPTSPLPLPGQGKEERMKRELEGGIIVIGRPSFKEVMHGLKQGWSEPLDIFDKEELLSQELQSDSVFDEVDTGDPVATDPPSSSNPSKTLIGPISPPFYSPLPFGDKHKAPTPNLPGSPIDPSNNEPPSSIPPYPPMLLLTFTNLVGFSLIPRMIWEFFNQRRKVREGAEAAYRLVSGNHRPFRGPSSSAFRPDEVDYAPSSDLSFGLDTEKYYKSSALVTDIEKARASFYEELPAKIKTARELSRSEREPTKDEKNFPPPTEVELRAERMKRELRWRRDLSGWAIINPAVPVAWDSRFLDSLFVYVDEQQPNGNKQDSPLC